MGYSRQIRRAEARQAAKQALKYSGTSVSAAAQVERTGPTGPRTLEGKAKSSLNNLRHGLAGAFRVLDGESQSEFDALAAALNDEHQPATTTELILVARLAEHVWLSRRAQTLQDAAITANSPANLALFLRYQTTHDRGFHKCLAQLSALRRERRLQSKQFESQKHQQQRHQLRVRIANARLARVAESKTRVEPVREPEEQTRTAA